MIRFKRTLMIVTSALLLAVPVVPCNAADSAFSDPALVGTPAEGALLVLSSKPSVQPDYLSTSAATDLLTSDSATTSATSLIAIEKGAVKISMPTITPEFQGGNAKGIAGVMVKAELISGKF